MSLSKGMIAVTQLLGLSEFEALEVQDDAKRKVRRIIVIPRVSAGVCPKCKMASDRRHQVRDRIIRDLPMGAFATELMVRIPQYECLGCDRKFTPGFESLAESAGATERFLERLAEMMRFGDVKNAAAFFGLPEKTLESWYYDYVRRRSAAMLAGPILSLGIDELSRKKSEGATAAC